jgi:hypothetical protein
MSHLAYIASPRSSPSGEKSLYLNIAPPIGGRRQTRAYRVKGSANTELKEVGESLHGRTQDRGGPRGRGLHRRPARPWFGADGYKARSIARQSTCQKEAGSELPSRCYVGRLLGEITGFDDLFDD